MSMNSFSFRSALSSSEPAEREITDLLELHPEGEAFPVDRLKTLSDQPYEILDLKRLREEVDPDERRAAPRFEIRYTVLIANHLQAFRTQSQNISATGLLLKDVLPAEFSNHPFDIVIIQTDSSGARSFLFFRGKAVPGPLRSRRVQFDALTRESEIKLQKAMQGAKPVM
jgi:hypothetical protein